MNKVQELIKQTTNKLVNTMKLTLGPKGKTVAYTKSSEFHPTKPFITKDGATVAINMMSNDKYENQILSMIREGSIQTMLSSGDGTTTTAILIQALINKGIDILNEGISFYELSKSYDKALYDIKDYIKNQSINLDNKPELLKDIASVSANDEIIGNQLYELVKEIGLYGDIDVRASMKNKVEIEKYIGIKLNHGWIDVSMCNKSIHKTFEAENVRVLVYLDEIKNIHRILPYIKLLNGINKNIPLLIVCEGIAPIAKKELVNLINNGALICAVELDQILNRKQIVADDIEAITGAYIIDDSYEIPIGYIDELEQVLGYSNFVIATANNCCLTGDMNNPDIKELIDLRIKDIKERLLLDDNQNNTELSNIERKFHKKRLANFTGGVATIFIGGNTQVEINELKDRYDDAVLAMQASVKDGVSIGGGYTFIHTAQHLKNKTIKNNIINNDCYHIVLNALESPFKELLINADIFNRYNEIKASIIKNKVYDLRTNKYIKIKDTTIYDSTKVLLDAIENAITVSKSLLSIQAIMYEGVLFE